MNEPPAVPGRIGLIADTHADAEALGNAIATLLHRGANTLVHLGDFCDSQNHAQLEQTFALLARHRVLAVKGNNDHQVEKMLENGAICPDAAKRRQWLRYLRQLPNVRRFGSICFCHSMPYETIRAFYDPVDTGGIEQAARVFHEVRDSAIFCGHTHAPVLFRACSGRVTREQMEEKSVIALQPEERYIIIIGAADNAECGIFDGNRKTYEPIRVSPPSNLEHIDEKSETAY